MPTFLSEKSPPAASFTSAAVVSASFAASVVAASVAAAVVSAGLLPPHAVMDRIMQDAIAIAVTFLVNFIM